jgi:hypothetical protein
VTSGRHGHQCGEQGTQGFTQARRRFQQQRAAFYRVLINSFGKLTLAGTKLWERKTQAGKANVTLFPVMGFLFRPESVTIAQGFQFLPKLIGSGGFGDWSFTIFADIEIDQRQLQDLGNRCDVRVYSAIVAQKEYEGPPREYNPTPESVALY